MPIIKTILVMITFLVLTNATYAQSRECEDAMYQAESYADDLESRAKKLMRCASNEGAHDLEKRAKKLQRCAWYDDYTDDCYFEFRKVKREYSKAEVCSKEYKKTKSVFSDYESAVSEVISYCD
ncbi:MAG: hypothetical protein HWE16_00520 [Gammaproteobacteria bacterium]|nr:hypothetical protein [Gammaproteobacteria bacterium]